MMGLVDWNVMALKATGSVSITAKDVFVAGENLGFTFGALFNSRPLQRCLRDAQDSAQHLMASNQSLDRYGAVLLADK